MKIIKNMNGTIIISIKDFNNLKELAEKKYIGPVKQPTIEEWLEKAKKEEGVIIVRLKGDYMGFLTSEQIASTLKKNIEFQEQVKKLPKIIKKWYKLDKL